jgi:hypothetical protein
MSLGPTRKSAPQSAHSNVYLSLLKTPFDLIDVRAEWRSCRHDVQSGRYRRLRAPATYNTDRILSLSKKSPSEFAVEFASMLPVFAWLRCHEAAVEEGTAVRAPDRLRCDAIVAVVQAADFRRRNDASGRGCSDSPRHRAVLREREMCACGSAC